MHSLSLIGLLCAGLARAAVTPTAPGPGQSFNAGADCNIQWNLDTTGKWTSFNIDLMTGSNTGMQLVTKVASGLDGTKGATSHTWTCPEVTPNSAIYFYQFTQAGAEASWTTRFTIASSTGATTPPANPTQPDGKNIPWGVGKLANGASPATTASATPATTTPATSATTPNASTAINATTAQNASVTPASTTSIAANTTSAGAVSTPLATTSGATTNTPTTSNTGSSSKTGSSTSSGSTSGTANSSKSPATSATTSGATSLLASSSLSLFFVIISSALLFAA